ncbi:MAG: hypothetical protein K2Y08_00590 [Alphaproteobacteria bacterium]|nr:hypothetical protein [Alphaproteobacteria bacterium]
MKKLLLSLVLSSSMLHCSAALAKQTNDDDEGSSIQVAPVPFSVSEIPVYPEMLGGTPPEIFKAAKNPSEGLLKHLSYNLFDKYVDFLENTITREKRYSMALTPKSPEENTVLGETYYSISSSEDASAPLSEQNYSLLMNYYIDASVLFEKIPGSPDKRKATLTVSDNSGLESSINLFLSVVTLQP